MSEQGMFQMFHRERPTGDVTELQEHRRRTMVKSLCRQIAQASGTTAAAVQASCVVAHEGAWNGPDYRERVTVRYPAAAC